MRLRRENVPPAEGDRSLPPGRTVVVAAALLMMTVLPAVFFAFPVIDVAAALDTPRGATGAALLVLLAIFRVVLLQWLLSGREVSTALKAVVVLELAVGLLGLGLLGRSWVALPVFGLVDVLLLLKRRAAAVVATAGVAVYVGLVARLYGGEPRWASSRSSRSLP